MLNIFKVYTINFADHILRLPFPKSNEVVSFIFRNKILLNTYEDAENVHSVPKTLMVAEIHGQASTEISASSAFPHRIPLASHAFTESIHRHACMCAHMHAHTFIFLSGVFEVGCQISCGMSF